jgi:hypothetical protein
VGQRCSQLAIAMLVIEDGISHVWLMEDMEARALSVESIAEAVRGDGSGGFPETPEVILDTAQIVERAWTDLLGPATVDWDEVLRMSNGWSDRLVAAARKRSFQDRKAAFHQELTALNRQKTHELGGLSLGFAFFSSNALRTRLARRIGIRLVDLENKSLSALVIVETDTQTRLQLTQVSFLLAAYRADSPLTMRATGQERNAFQGCRGVVH